MIPLVAAVQLAAACPEGLCNAAALAPFYAKLARAQSAPRQGRPLHILQIGDSHTAGDQITGAWRDVLQARFGSGGRGVLPPGRPYDGYITRGVSVTMSPGWSIYGDFGKAYSETHPALGLSAYSLVGAQEGATMALDADGSERFDRLTVCAIARPGGGNLAVRLGQDVQTMDLSSISERPLCHTMRSDQPQTHADLTTVGGPVTVTSWATFADHNGGIVLSNVGVVGSQLIHFSRTDDTVLSEEFRAYQPDLIVLAFGTNEGFGGRFSSFEYEAILRSQVGRIRRLAGNVPILILGAPDALTRRDDLKDNAGIGPSPACSDTAATAALNARPAPTPPPTTTGTFGTAMARIGDFLGITSAAENGRMAVEEGQKKPIVNLPPGAVVQPLPIPAVRPGLYPPPALGAVRDAQRRVAASLHLAYWDWVGRMGGPCTALAWVRSPTPLMRSDYVHYTSAGGREIAQRLQADLDKAAR